MTIHLSEEKMVIEGKVSGRLYGDPGPSPAPATVLK